MALARELPPNFVLKYGSHNTPDAGMCLMEAVAFVAGEPHSDSPRRASPELAAIGRSLNDRYTDDERQLLAPLIPRLVGTQGGGRARGQVARGAMPDVRRYRSLSLRLRAQASAGSSCDFYKQLSGQPIALPGRA